MKWERLENSLTWLRVAIASTGEQKWPTLTGTAGQFHRNPHTGSIVSPKVGNRFEVGCKPPQQPHQFDVALCFSFKAAAGLNTVEVTVDVQLEQNGWMVRRPSGGFGIDADKAKPAQIELLDKGIHNSHRVVFTDLVIKQLW